MAARARKLKGFPERIMGLENEYGLMVRGPKSPSDVLAAVCGHSRKWFANGGCVYQDVGHIETCTPEVRSGYDVLVYDRALEQIVQQRLAAMPYAGLIEAHLLKNNIGLEWTDDRAQETTFGCHENYLIGMETAYPRLVVALAPFLATRLLFAGFGSVVRRSKTTWGFELSQRARHVQQLSSRAATYSRGFAKYTSESLGDNRRHQRLQLVVGDANILWEPAAYKLDLTSLMLLMFENGALPVITLEGNPTKVLHDVSRHGPTAPVELAGGVIVNALDLQDRYLAAAVAFVDRWQLEKLQPALAYWREVLTALRAGDKAALYGRVDWVTKRQLLRRAEQRGGSLSWEQAFRRDLAYHDLTLPVPNLPGQIRQVTDPPGLAAAVARALVTPPPGRPAIRGALLQLAAEYDAEATLGWTTGGVTYPGQRGYPHREWSMPDPYDDYSAIVEEAREFLHLYRSLAA